MTQVEQTDRVTSLIKLLSENGDYSEDHYKAQKQREKRINAIVELRNIQTPEAFKAIVSALSDQNLFVRYNATRALTAFGSDAILPLINTLNDKEWKPRSGAAISLVELKDVGSVKILIDALRTAEELVKLRIIEVLGQAGDNAAIPTLKKLSESKNTNISQYATKSLNLLNITKPEKKNPSLIMKIDSEKIYQNKLPERLRQQLLDVRDEWRQVALSTAPANRELAEHGVDLVYQAAGLVPPKSKIWLRSPREGVIGFALLENRDLRPIFDKAKLKLEDRDDIKKHVKSKVYAQLSQFLEQDEKFTNDASRILKKFTRELKGQGWDQGWIQIQNKIWLAATKAAGSKVELTAWDEFEELIKKTLGDPLWENILKGIWPDIEENKKYKIVPPEMGLAAGDFGLFYKLGRYILDSAMHPVKNNHWLACYNGLKGFIPESPKLEGLSLIAKNCDWWWPMENAVILIERPIKNMRDKNGFLHCADGPAIEFRDGFNIYAWHGHILPRKQQYFIDDHSKLASADSVDREEIARTRMAKLELYGYEKYLKERPHKILDEDTHNDQSRQLIEVRVRNSILKILHTANEINEEQASTRPGYERVAENIKTIQEALTFLNEKG